MHFLSLPCEVHLGIFEQLSFDGHVEIEIRGPLTYWADLARCVPICKQLEPIVNACLWQGLYLNLWNFVPMDPIRSKRGIGMFEVSQSRADLAQMVRYLHADAHAANLSQLASLSTLLTSTSNLVTFKLHTNDSALGKLLATQWPLLPSVRELILTHWGLYGPKLCQFYAEMTSRCSSHAQIAFDSDEYGTLLICKAGNTNKPIGITTGNISEDRERSKYLSFFMEALLGAQGSWNIIRMGVPKYEPTDDLWVFEGSFVEYLRGQEDPLVHCKELLATLNPHAGSTEEWEDMFNLFPNLSTLNLVLQPERKSSVEIEQFLTYFLSSGMVRQLKHLKLDLSRASMLVPPCEKVSPIAQIGKAFLETCCIQLDFACGEGLIMPKRLLAGPTQPERARFTAASLFLMHATEDGSAKEGHLMLSFNGYLFAKLIFRNGRFWDGDQLRLVFEGYEILVQEWDWKSEAAGLGQKQKRAQFR